MVSDDKLQWYVKEFLIKPVESEYYLNKLAEFEIGVKFLAPLEEHELFKFVSLNNKFDVDLIKSFYCNLKVTSDGLECHLRNKRVKFTLKDFEIHFGLLSKENEVCISNAPDFVKFDLVKVVFPSEFLVIS